MMEYAENTGKERPALRSLRDFLSAEKKSGGKILYHSQQRENDIVTDDCMIVDDGRQYVLLKDGKPKLRRGKLTDMLKTAYRYGYLSETEYRAAMIEEIHRTLK